jgi:hypothetical protein
MAARSKITGEGCSGAGTLMNGTVAEEEGVDELDARESA